MITRNFRVWLRGMTLTSNATVYMKARNGDSYTVNRNDNVMLYSYRTVILGSNDTPATVDDYELDTITQLTYVNSTTEPHGGSNPNYSTSNNGSYTTTTYTNDTNEPITVKEIGLISSATYSNPSQTVITDEGHSYLLIREVLDTPVIIQPNETYSFTMKFM